ncbi:MAG TPA: polyhydroxyalkanoate depolymerase [Rhodospirillaceae bacterium]|nr:MAG: hypothetical protein A2018_04655 [Alphaproteobacteria bacterium GWF2_58_20]HAU28810.1 polyhydroxyalkanoate depolymerase [Rhodospirillaceae bacterium]
MTHNPLLYPAEEARKTMMSVWADMAETTLAWQKLWVSGMSFWGMPSLVAEDAMAVLDALAQMARRMGKETFKPDFGISRVRTPDGMVDVRQQVVAESPLGPLLRFARNTARKDPKILIVSPMSGNHATLLRDTIAGLLQEHDVYITDWRNARDIPLEEGDFGMEDFITHTKSFIRHLGPDVHVIGISQSTITALAAVARIAEETPEMEPVSLTLMVGPVDTRVSENSLARMVKEHSQEWFAENLIAEVPGRYAGAGRLVYPGFLQLAGYMAKHFPNYMTSQASLFAGLCAGDAARVRDLKVFLDECQAVCDLPGKFYLETLDKVFRRADLAEGRLMHAGEKVNPSAITKTSLLTVEAGEDELVSKGQTFAAHALCCGVASGAKHHIFLPKAGHYGAVSGSIWRRDVLPQLVGFIRRSSGLGDDAKQAKKARVSLPEHTLRP